MHSRIDVRESVEEGGQHWRNRYRLRLEQLLKVPTLLRPQRGPLEVLKGQSGIYWFEMTFD